MRPQPFDKAVSGDTVDVVFTRDSYHVRHWFFGDGAIQDLTDLYGFWRTGIYLFRHSSPRCVDCASFQDARRTLIDMHRQLFARVVWC